MHFVGTLQSQVKSLHELSLRAHLQKSKQDWQRNSMVILYDLHERNKSIFYYGGLSITIIP